MRATDRNVTSRNNERTFDDAVIKWIDQIPLGYYYPTESDVNRLTTLREELLRISRGALIHVGSAA